MAATVPQHSFLKSITTHKQIHDNPLNLSPTKMQYSFPHASRFVDPRTRVTSNVPFYEVDSTLRRSLRTCSLGKGNKYDFTKNNKDVPAPNSYYPRNHSISANLANKRGFTFGVSRDLAPQNGILYMSRLGGVKPGPGAYSPAPVKSHQTVTFRIKTGKQNFENVNVGPGKYNIGTAFEPSKVIFNSRFRSTKSTKFAPLRELANTSANTQETPEQGGEIQTSMNHQINPKGVFFNSKYHNSMCRSFGKADREGKLRSQNPLGPGDYQMPSEFGIYVSSKFS